MKKEVNFLNDNKCNFYLYTTGGSTTQDNLDFHELELTKQIVELDRSQYIYTKNNEKWSLWLNKYYPLMCELAELQGGRVALNIDEINFVGVLSYWGKELILNNIFSNNLCSVEHMLKLSDDFVVRSNSELIEIQFFFSVYDKQKVSDHTYEMKNLQAQSHFSE